MKSDYLVVRVNRRDVAGIIKKYHYLSPSVDGFTGRWFYGLIRPGIPMEVVGACVFGGMSAPELAVGMLGEARNNQADIYELTRFVLRPDVQKSEHNLASWFLSRATRLLVRDADPRMVLAYSDSTLHTGVIYAASGWSYHGLSDARIDFYKKEIDGTYKKVTRGKVRNLSGEWRPRSQKHRFTKVFKSDVKIKWAVVKWTNGGLMNVRR